MFDEESIEPLFLKMEDLVPNQQEELSKDTILQRKVCETRRGK